MLNLVFGACACAAAATVPVTNLCIELRASRQLKTDEHILRFAQDRIKNNEDLINRYPCQTDLLALEPMDQPFVEVFFFQLCKTYSSKYF